jgi:selenocysteine-specific elongation factor
MFYTIATAGHIDHGKSTLVKALTGINPDRLPEEQEREMTIDLGFAWFTSSDGSEVGIVDVPGHERFVRNMIAGVGGIDYVLFIVAADDGWMPQSQEHLEILDFLDHKHGAVILTKTDLADKDWIDLVSEDIKNKTAGTFLENAPILKFSSQGNTGLEEIIKHLEENLPTLPQRYNPQKPRLFIDRVFSMAGIGTIVTGTMRDGGFVMGDELAIMPSGKSARIKSIQTFKQQREQAFQGARAALALTGISKEDISRGDCLVGPSSWKGTRSIALRLKLSSLARIPLTHNRRLIALIGTTEVEAGAKLFRDEKLGPGDEGVCILSFDQNVNARLGDRIVLRYPTPDLLVGGGVVTDVDPQKFIRRDKDMRKFYFERVTDSAPELILSELRKFKTRTMEKLLEASNLGRDEIKAEVEKLIESGNVEQFGSLLVGAEFKLSLFGKILDYMRAFHKNFPMKSGVSKSELISKLRLDEATADFALANLQKEKKIELKEKLISLAGHSTSLKPEQDKIRTEILEKLTVPDLQTPSRKEIERKLHVIREVLNYLVRSGEVIELSEGVLFRLEDYERIKGVIIDMIKKRGAVAVKEIKDVLGLSRKYTIPILERMDRDGITRREGDRRELND